MFQKILIANRGAIACRILRTVKALGLRSVAIYSEADANAPHVRQADEAYCVGPAPAAESYLRQERILEIARLAGAEAIHPGYGFLSENAAFAAACEAAGVAFIGPSPAQMRDFGLKHTARELAASAGLPLLPGTGLLADLPAALAAAGGIGYPVMLKSTAGGGGIGMRCCNDARDLEESFAAVQRLAAGNFSNAGVFLEKFVSQARHIEVQIFGDGRGRVIALGERDCSVQRRNQKVIEESPAPGLGDARRAELHDAAARLGQSVGYRSAGTVEFVYDAASTQFYFLEVNTRLQVEHGVTEEVGGVDLVEWMIRTAAGEPPDLAALRFQARGHAIQARVYAEDPARNFRPSSGVLTRVKLPSGNGIRVDGWIEDGTEVTGYYDPMLAKIIARGATREQAIGKLAAALADSRIDGIETNLPYLVSVLEHPVFAAGEQTTGLLGRHSFTRPAIEVLSPGTLTTVQDWPGRLGLWDVGVPPSGPMDALALRLANRIVGNDQGCAALEMTVTGATLRFDADTVIALTGASMEAALDGAAVPFWEPLPVKRGSVLALGRIQGAGQRAYLAVRGGFDIPEYLGSRATFTLGQFGGHGGRALRAGDILRLVRSGLELEGCEAIEPAQRPQYFHEWQIGVTDGPHGAPDFFTPADIRAFFDAEWEVHYNSSRTGVRLIGPKPAWARSDGGEAGLHPSNIHDNAYAIGSIDFTGDMPVILGPDGPSLGGFVCPATIVQDELWKIGQLRPGDKLRFRRVAKPGRRVDNPAVLLELPASATHSAVCVRRAGENNVLVELGAPALDLVLRFQVQALLEELNRARLPGIIDLTPGIRSLQVHYDGGDQAAVLEWLEAAFSRLPGVERMRLPSRIVHLPLSWDDPATQLATLRYQTTVRADAPWCPDNIEFIRRINGLESRDAVREIVFNASYLVMGLGDVYLGAPVATPLDPRHRLVTTKYNPARTWTPENAVGIGGAYLCVYGMEGPGGYQFVGRTVQMWNRYKQTADFRDGKQWLLRFFDQIRFYPVSAEELLELRAGFPHGRHPLRIEETSLELGEYLAFLERERDSIAAFQARQRAAFAAERERWRIAGLSETPAVEAAAPADNTELPENCIAVTSPVSGSVWQVKVKAGQTVAKGDALVIMEAMKMEIAVLAETAGTVISIHGTAGKGARAGDLLLALRPVNS